MEFFARIAYLTFQLDERQIWQSMELDERLDGLLAHYCKKLRLQRSFTVIPESKNEVVSEIIEFMKEQAKREVMMKDEGSQGALATDSMLEESASMSQAAGSMA